MRGLPDVCMTVWCVQWEVYDEVGTLDAPGDAFDAVALVRELQNGLRFHGARLILRSGRQRSGSWRFLRPEGWTMETKTKFTEHDLVTWITRTYRSPAESVSACVLAVRVFAAVAGERGTDLRAHLLTPDTAVTAVAALRARAVARSLAKGDAAALLVGTATELWAQHWPGVRGR